jgi:hypothetical protein
MFRTVFIDNYTRINVCLYVEPNRDVVEQHNVWKSKTILPCHGVQKHKTT